MVWKSDGEKLFFMVKTEAVESDSSLTSSWSRVANSLESVSGSVDFSKYIIGAVSVHAVRRMMRYWIDEKPSVQETNWIKKISSFLSEDVFPGLSQHLVAKIARALVAAEQAADKDIPPSVKKIVLANSKIVKCYLCDHSLDTAAKKGTREFLTLEHLWPSSMGGNSTEENLLPACERCQQAKSNAISWEWFNVHNFILPYNPSDEAMKAVTWQTRIAMHYYKVMRICENEKISLKEGFLNQGPIQHQIQNRRRTNLPRTFFDL